MSPQNIARNQPGDFFGEAKFVLRGDISRQKRLTNNVGGQSFEAVNRRTCIPKRCLVSSKRRRIEGQAALD
jgi:hypothetical protein